MPANNDISLQVYEKSSNIVYPGEDAHHVFKGVGLKIPPRLTKLRDYQKHRYKCQDRIYFLTEKKKKVYNKRRTSRFLS